MLKGFTGDYYNGIPVFIREEYEEVNSLYYEYERLGDYLDLHYDSLSIALADAENKEPRLLYRRKSNLFDDQLRGFNPVSSMWHPYRMGYVHEITGEYVVSSTVPNYDSYPCWVKVSDSRTHKSDRERKVEAAFAGLFTALQNLHLLNKED